MPEAIHTIGHSTRPIEEFVDLLHRSSIDLVVDVRTVPRSRTNPQYNSDTLAGSLADAGIGYERMPALGGLRGRNREIAPTTNGFWENESFHNYADYATTEPFRKGLDELKTRAKVRRVAIMCSEAVWWRCHRRIIADYLIHDGVDVRHIVSATRVELAKITAAAKAGPHRTLTYPREPTVATKPPARS